MQKNPSEQLVLLALDEPADAARSIDHEDADMYMELARQANFNQGNFPIAGFVLNVLGGKASPDNVKTIFTTRTSWKKIKVIEKQ